MIGEDDETALRKKKELDQEHDQIIKRKRKLDAILEETKGVKRSMIETIAEIIDNEIVE